VRRVITLLQWLAGFGVCCGRRLRPLLANRPQWTYRGSAFGVLQENGTVRIAVLLELPISHGPVHRATRQYLRRSRDGMTDRTASAGGLRMKLALRGLDAHLQIPDRSADARARLLAFSISPL